MVKKIGAILICSIIGAATLYAQQTSNIVGLVQDTTGAVIPHVSVTIINSQTDQKRNVFTNDKGEYTASSLPIGRYVIRAKKAGFKRLTQTGVILTTASTLTVNLTMQVGSQKQTIRVTGRPPLLQSQSGQISALVDSKEMVGMPLATRNFAELVLLTPGAHGGTAGSYNDPGQGNGGSLYSINGGTNYSVNGSMAAGNSYLIDGLYNRNQWLNTNVMVPVIDSIAEYRVMESNFNAQYGDAAGAVTTVTTKSGTNQFHGTVWEFLRNNILNANYYFANLNGTPRGGYHRNVFGGDLGGPILKNRLFFFGDYQGVRQTRPSVTTLTIPTQAEVNMVETGNFNGIGLTLYNPYSGTSKSRDAFPDNIIPKSYLDPAAQKLFALLPAPTRATANNNYIITPSSVLNSNQFDVRLDDNVGSEDHLFFKYSFQRPYWLIPGTMYPRAGAAIQVGPYLSNGSISHVQTQSGTIGYSHIFSPTLLLDAHAGILRWYAHDNPMGQQYASATAIGISGINYNSLTGGLPAVSISGFAGLGNSSTAPEDSEITTFQYDAEVTKVAGTHTLKAGILFLRNRFNGFTEQPARGTFSFNGEFTSQIGHQSTKRALADFAIGAERGAHRGVLEGEFGIRDFQLGGYFQDTWRVTNRFTAVYGARYDVDVPPLEVHNHWANLDIRTGLLRVAGLDGNGRRLRNTDFNTFQPRLGFAYSFGKERDTVLRSGFGISYVDELIGGQQLYKNLPYFFDQEVVTSNTAPPPTTFSKGFPTPVAPDPNNIQAISVGSPTAWNVNNPESRVISYSLGVQHAFPANVVAEVSYVGTRGEHLMYNNLNLNQSFPGPGPQGPRRPYYNINPNLVNVNYRSAAGDSYYNSLQVYVQKRFSRNFDFGIAYTYASFLADVGDPNAGGNGNIQNVRCLRCNLGPTPSSYTHVLAIHHVISLPFGTGRKYLNHGWVSYLVGPWDFNGIWRLHTGGRFTVYYADNVSNSAGGGTQRPNRIGSGELAHGRSITHWFNTADFVAPAQYAFGNSGTGILTGPAFFDVDLALERHIIIRRHYNIDLRGEAFNAFNRANFDDPNSTVGNNNTGVINGTGEPRIMQLALKVSF